MQDPGALWVVVPAYNEAELIATVVSSLRSEGYTVVVVDDGSADQTGEIAREAGAIVLRHLMNLGQGGALHTGMTFCVQSGARYICTFDADGQHCAKDIATLWKSLASDNLDIVLGSRFLGDAAGIPRSRKLLLKMAVLFTRLHSGLKLTDAHNGLRVMTPETASRLKLKQMGMAHASEILSQITKLKLKYSEAPVTVVYTDYSRAKGQSAFGSIRILTDLIIGRMLR